MRHIPPSLLSFFSLYDVSPHDTLTSHPIFCYPNQSPIQDVDALAGRIKPLQRHRRRRVVFLSPYETCVISARRKR